jgi:hypothetical protein
MKSEPDTTVPYLPGSTLLSPWTQHKSALASTLSASSAGVRLSERSMSVPPGWRAADPVPTTSGCSTGQMGLLAAFGLTAHP